MITFENDRRICSRCVMDSSAQEITFDNSGICHFCREAEARLQGLLKKRADSRNIDRVVEKLRHNGQQQKYDCVFGLSGGVDSSYALWLLKQFGLRPLVVHLDNGWNSEIANTNIEKLVKGFGFDLMTHVLDWPTFRRLQVAFLEASTPDAEIPTDHAIFALLYATANRMRIRYIVTGSNPDGESIMPRSWAYGHTDWRYINAVRSQMGAPKPKNFPKLTVLKKLYYRASKRISAIPILEFVSYNREQAIAALENYGHWRNYPGGKHGESTYTRFFQNYILPKKFGIDKRRAHFSSYICAGQMTRFQALEKLKIPGYADSRQLDLDLEYVLKKLELTEERFDQIMKLPVKSFNNFPNNQAIGDFFGRWARFLKQRGIIENSEWL